MKPEAFIETLNRTDEYISIIFLNGGCYQFYKVLKSLYPSAKPYINLSNNHIITKIGNEYFDISGKVDGSTFKELQENQIKYAEQWSFCKTNWLGKVCENCGEMMES